MNDKPSARAESDDDTALTDAENHRLEELAFKMRQEGATKGMIVQRLIEESATHAGHK